MIRLTFYILLTLNLFSIAYGQPIVPGQPQPTPPLATTNEIPAQIEMLRACTPTEINMSVPIQSSLQAAGYSKINLKISGWTDGKCHITVMISRMATLPTNPAPQEVVQVADCFLTAPTLDSALQLWNSLSATDGANVSTFTSGSESMTQIFSTLRQQCSFMVNGVKVN